MSTMQLSPSASPSTSSGLSPLQLSESASQSANGSERQQGPSSSLSETSPPSLSPSIESREQLVEYVAREHWPMVSRFWRRFRHVNDLEIGSAWSKLLEWIWLHFDMSKLADDEHLRSLVKRQMAYLMSIEIRSRGMRSPSGSRGSWNVVHSLDDGDGIMHKLIADTGSPGLPDLDDLQLDRTPRRDHPMLGSCRIDLAAAFDQLSAQRQITVVARIVHGLTEIQTQHYFGMTRSQVQQNKHHGVAQLKKLMSGEYQTKGGRLRFVPDIRESEGFRWEEGSRYVTDRLTAIGQ